MREDKLQRWLKTVELELRAEPGFTDDYTGKIVVNTTQGGANHMQLQKDRHVKTAEKK